MSGMSAGLLGNVGLLVLVALSVVVLILADISVIVPSLLLCYLSFFIARGTVARIARIAAVFAASFLALSSLSQVLVLGQPYILSNAIISIKMFSLALGSVAIASNIYKHLLRRVYSNWQILSLFLAMRSLTEGFLALSESLEAIKINYGYSSRRNPLSLIKLVISVAPVLLLEIILRRFEVMITMLTRTDLPTLKEGTFSCENR